MQGELIQSGNKWQLRFTRELPHPPDKVWQAITEPEHLKAWFPMPVIGEWKVGAPLKFPSEYGDFDGEVIEVRPQSSLEFRWGTDIIRFEVVPHDNGTRLTLLDTLDQRGKAARDAAGWHSCLDNLEAHLAGRLGSSDWTTLNNKYVAQFGPEASAIGPPAKVTSS